MNNKKKLFHISGICFAFLLAFVFSIAISNTSEAATLGKVTNIKQTYGSYDAEYGKYFIDLEYTGVSGAYGYLAQISTDNKTWQFVKEAYKSTQFSIGSDTNLTAGSTYYVRIIPIINSNFDYDLTDASASIQVVTAPASVTTVKQTKAGSNSITTSWSGVSGATGYNVYVKKYGDSTYTLNGSSKSASYTVKKYKNAKLKIDSCYYVSVCATKTSTAGFTAVAAPSNGYPFYTLPSKITKLSTSSCDWKPGSASLKVSWSHTNIADGYQLQFYNAKNKSIKKVTTTKNSYTLTKAPKNSSCSVKIRPYVKSSSGSKLYGSWSSKFYFLSQANMSNTTYSIGYGKLTLRWKAVSGATKYTIYAGTSKSNMKSVGSVSGSATSYTFSKISGSTISPYGYYYVKVVPQKKLGGKTVKGDFGYYWTIH